MEAEPRGPLQMSSPSSSSLESAGWSAAAMANSNLTPIDHSSSRLQASASRFGSYLNERIRPNSFAELQLILLTFCIGLQDAVSFPDFHCFASNQTGNTVFLVLAIVLPEMNGEMFTTGNIGVALGLFLAAAWLTGQVGHIVGPRQRWWLILCNFIQTALVFAAAALQYTAGVELTGDRTLVAIGLLASAAGSQVVLSRALEMTEITTAMATAAWLDLVIDPSLFALRNRSRNRRVAFLGSLVLGTLVGAFIYKRIGSPAVLAVSGAGKLLVTVMFCFSGAEGNKTAGSEPGKEEV